MKKGGSARLRMLVWMLCENYSIGDVFSGKQGSLIVTTKARQGNYKGRKEC